MGMYRDSKLGLCIDIYGPDGNIFVLWGHGSDLARQLDQTKEWSDTLEAAKKLDCSYLMHLNVFKQFFPMVTLVGYDKVLGTLDELAEEKEDG